MKWNEPWGEESTLMWTTLSPCPLVVVKPDQITGLYPLQETAHLHVLQQVVLNPNEVNEKPLEENLIE